MELTVQKAARMGMPTMKKKKIVVLRPPPTLRERYQGIRKRREKRAMLEKVSLPGPSAGRGAFLIAGYYMSGFRLA